MELFRKRSIEEWVKEYGNPTTVEVSRVGLVEWTGCNSHFYDEPNRAETLAKDLKPLPKGTLFHAFLIEDLEDLSCLRYDVNRFLPCCTDVGALDSVSTLRTQRNDLKLCIWKIDVKEGTLGIGTNVGADANFENEKEILLQQNLRLSYRKINKYDNRAVVLIKAENGSYA